MTVLLTANTPGRLHISHLGPFWACLQVGKLPNKVVGGLLQLGPGYYLLLIGLELEMDTLVGRWMDTCHVGKGLSYFCSYPFLGVMNMF